MLEEGDMVDEKRRRSEGALKAREQGRAGGVR